MRVIVGSALEKIIEEEGRRYSSECISLDN
jgi:hypothetical protein